MQNTIQLSLKKTDDRITSFKFVTGYEHLDLGVPVEVGHVVKGSSSKVNLQVVTGGLYSVKVWTIHKQYISLVPKEEIYKTQSLCKQIYITRL